MNYVIFLLILVIILYCWVIIRGHQSGEIYTKWGMYTGKWFIKRDKDPEAYEGKLSIYFTILIILTFSLIVMILIEIS